jgi:hypothetical protein
MSEINATAAEMARAASDFLSALTPAQRRKAFLPYDEEERRRWFYTPNERGGLPLIEMGPTQQRQALRLLRTGLSETGYNVATTVMGLENTLLAREGFNAMTYPLRGGDTRFRDPAMYYVAVFGAPGDDTWGWRYGGHHVSFQYTLRDGIVAATPAFFGANPASAPMPGGRTLRPLAAEEDTARELLLALSPEQQNQAIISPAAPTDIVQSNRSAVEEGALPLPAGSMMGRPRLEGEEQARRELGLTPALDEVLRYARTPKGLFAADMDVKQREVLTRLLRIYLDRVPASVSAQYAEALEPANIDGTAFAWAGPAKTGAPHYYRLHSDRLLIEYDNTQNGANHIHSVWRDLQLDFGGDVLAQHYAAAH